MASSLVTWGWILPVMAFISAFFITARMNIGPANSMINYVKNMLIKDKHKRLEVIIPEREEGETAPIIQKIKEKSVAQEKQPYTTGATTDMKTPDDLKFAVPSEILKEKIVFPDGKEYFGIIQRKAISKYSNGEAKIQELFTATGKLLGQIDFTVQKIVPLDINKSFSNGRRIKSFEIIDKGYADYKIDMLKHKDFVRSGDMFALIDNLKKLRIKEAEMERAVEKTRHPSYTGDGFGSGFDRGYPRWGSRQYRRSDDSYGGGAEGME